MKKGNLTALSTAIIVLASLPLISGLPEAATSALTLDGHVLTVEIIVDQYSPSIQGLVVFDQSLSSISSETILTTWDSVVDHGPNIAMSPFEGQPVLVWSRQEGTDFELAMMRRRPGGFWEPFQILTNNQSQDVESRVIVDGNENAHIVWWPSGVGGSVFLRTFEIRNGRALGLAQKPFEGSGSKNKLNTSVTGGSSIGGSEDPGTIGGLNVRASADPCPANPAAAPEHGVVLGCGRPAAYQLSACKLLIGIYDATSLSWGLTVVDVTNVSMSQAPTREMVQSLVDSRCQQ